MNTAHHIHYIMHVSMHSTPHFCDNVIISTTVENHDTLRRFISSSCGKPLERRERTNHCDFDNSST